MAAMIPTRSILVRGVISFALVSGCSSGETVGPTTSSSSGAGTGGTGGMGVASSSATSSSAIASSSASGTAGGGGMGGAGGCGGGQAAWASRAGDADVQYGSQVVLDAADNMFVTGYFKGTVDLGGGPLTSAGDYDFFVAKFDASGKHVWSKRFGGPGSDIATLLLLPSGDLLLGGAFEGMVDFGGGPLTSAGGNDAFLLKLDPLGSHIWSKRFGDAGTNQSAVPAALDPLGNVYVIGNFDSTLSLGGPPLVSVGAADVFVAKLDTDGNHLWSRSFGGAQGDYMLSLSPDTQGNALITGGTTGTIDLGGGPLMGGGNFTGFVAKLDSMGTHVWSKSLGEAGAIVRMLADGSAVLGGGFIGTLDLGGGPISGGNANHPFIAKLDPSGKHIFSKGFGDATTKTIGPGFAVDPSGAMFLVGGVAGALDLGGGALPPGPGGFQNLFVAKFDPGGKHVYSRRYGDGLGQIAQSIAVTSAGGLVLTGWFDGTIDLGTGPLTSAGSFDVLLARLCP